MRVYNCDSCGAEFVLGEGEFDDVCPECGSDKTILFDETEEVDDDDDWDDELDEGDEL